MDLTGHSMFDPTSSSSSSSLDIWGAIRESMQLLPDFDGDFLSSGHGYTHGSQGVSVVNPSSSSNNITPMAQAELFDSAGRHFDDPFEQDLWTTIHESLQLLPDYHSTELNDCYSDDQAADAWVLSELMDPSLSSRRHLSFNNALGPQSEPLDLSVGPRGDHSSHPGAMTLPIDWIRVQHELSAPLWVPPPGTGSLKRTYDQMGGAIGEASLIEAVHVSAPVTIVASDGLVTKKTVRVQMKHNLSEIEDILTVAEEIDASFDSIVRPLIEDAETHDFVAADLEHPDLDEAIRLCFVHKINWNPQAFLNAIYRWVQSNAHQFLMDGELTVSVTIVKNPHGGSRSRRLGPVVSADSFHNRRNCVIDIISSRNDCGWRAVALGKFIADYPQPRKNNHNLWRQVCAKDSTVLRTLVFELFGAKTEEMSASDFRDVQDLLPGYQFIVILKPTRDGGDLLAMHKPLFKGEPAEKRIVVELNSNHFRVITSLKAYYSVDNNEFCVHCWCSVSRYHTCSGFCSLCGNQECKEDMVEKVCPDCNMVFKNEGCFGRHACGKKLKRCPDCEVVYQSNISHSCGQFVCHSCEEVYSVSPHRCYIKPLDMAKLQAEDALTQVIVCFDIESRIIARGEHAANLLICQTICDICTPGSSEKQGVCDNCGVFEQQFFGDDCVSRFLDYVLVKLSVQVAEKSRGKIHVFSHNAKGYDNHFIVGEILKRNYLGVKPVMQGGKVLVIDMANVRFQDSMAFLQLPLSGIPNALGYSGYPLKKGHFPHLFNKKENYGVVAGKWPDASDYEPESMRDKEKAEFMAWYESVKHQKFSFMEEFISYCRTDVEILMMGVRKYRDLYRAVTGINPVTRPFTLAGMVFENFRASDLKEKVIGVTPVDGYLETRKSSAEGNAWLDLIVKKTGKKILREQHIGPYWVDGIEGKEVFEYLGCYFHGCPKCYGDDERLAGGKTRCELFMASEKRLDYFHRKGYTLYCAWGCDSVLNDDPYFKERKRFWQRLKNLDVRGPRDALAGGRTENFKLMHDCAEDEEIKYVDFVSLYPYVLKHRDFPVGHGQLITEEVRYEAGKYFGFVYCTVLPPKNLLIPVLPMHKDEKLLFTLCGKCGPDSGACLHTDTERALSGLFVTEELDLALSKGYKLLSAEFVIHFETRSRDIFAPFIDRWLKVKLEASGYPDHVVTEEEKDRFIEETFKKEGIRLEKDKIRKNPGLRFISKLMLNSLWGRLAMRGNMWQTSIISRFQDFMEIVSDEKREVLSPFFLPGEKSMMVNWRYKEEKDARQNNTSPALAAFVTAYGRMKLYELIDQIESVRPGRACYCDTDSLFFIHKVGDPEVETGFQLGELTDEECGKRIICALFCGPKSYCYVTQGRDGQEKAVVKCKGVTLTNAASKVVNASSMRGLITKYLAGEKEVLAVPQLRFSANKRQQIVRSEWIVKRFQVTSSKRRVIGMETVPFGYTDLLM